MRRTLRRSLVGGVTFLSVLVCAAAVTLWAMSYRSPRSVRFYTRLGRSELVAFRGRLEFDNEPQWRWELERATGELERSIDAEYAAARRAYEASGRDLGDEAHPELREQMAEHVQRAAELDMQFAAAAEGVKQRWRAKPAVHRSVSLAGVAGGAMVWPGVVLVTLATAALRRTRRRASGRCQGCGYDLRATPGRCPECGLTPASFHGE